MITNEDLKNLYSANSSRTSFPFTFQVTDETDILVETYRDGVATTETAITVTLNADGSGTVVFDTAPTTGDIVVIRPNLDLTQDTDLIEAGAYSSDEVERALDRNVILIKQISEQIARCIKLDPTVTDTELPASGSGYFYWDGTNLSVQDLVYTTTAYSGSITLGADASKPAAPSIGDFYFATDTNKVYRCYQASSWNNIGNFSSIACTGNATVGGDLDVTGDISGVTISGVDGNFTDDLVVGDDVDIGGDVDIDGTLETDAITLAGAAINDANGLVTLTSGGIVKGKRFGALVNKSSSYGAQQATTDCVIEAWAARDSGAVDLALEGFTDSNANPSTQVQYARMTTDGHATGINIMFAVKKNDYWKVTVSNQSSIGVYLTPVGD